MDERRSRSDEVRWAWYILIFLVGWFTGLLCSLVLVSEEDYKPHVAEIYCTQEHVGKVYAIYSNHPFVDVKEYDINKP